MDLRLTFNEDAQNYEKLRPTYTKELYEDIIQFSRLDKNRKALEIGIGTGQATYPFLKTGCRITAIEIGDKLAQFSREKFERFEGFEVISRDFEGAPLDENDYDLVYSASAFHWIPEEIGLPKVSRVLKSGGAFAWFSIQPAPSQEYMHVYHEIQKVYDKYSEFFEGQRPQLDPEIRRQQLVNKQLNRSNTLKRYGFVDVMDKLYYGKRIFSAQNYVALISTYSDHIAIPEERRIPFLKGIEDTINLFDGEFALSDTMLLSMGRKP